MLQRQIMFKQLEELQRQKKLQGLNDSRQQNVINQQSLIHTKQASGAQYAPLINGTPVRDPSQMFMFGNPNLTHGFQNGSPYSQAQNQVLNSINLASQPLDGHSFSRFSHFHGSTREPTGEQMDIISRSSVSDQFNVSYPEKNVFGSYFSQEQDSNTCQDYTSLDPLEQKFLFNSDDDNLGSLFEENDNNSQQFPSVQSGSWSALMQSALEETSSTDTGVQEEWSGLSFQNPELSNDNQHNNYIESQTLWQNNNIFHVKTSNASSSFHQGPSEDFEFVSNNGTEFNKVPLKDHNSQRSSEQVSISTIQPNVWVDIPSQQNLADVANNRIETASEHVLDSQGFDYTKGQQGKIPFEEVSSLKQTHISPLNPAYTELGQQ